MQITMRRNTCLNACFYTIQICCLCKEPGNSKLFLTCLGEKKSAGDILLPSPTEIEFSLLTRGRNVCCAQLFSSYHRSLQPPPHLSSFTLCEGCNWAERARHCCSNLLPQLSPLLLKGQQWWTSGCQRGVLLCPLIVLPKTLFLNRMGGNEI